MKAAPRDRHVTEYEERTKRLAKLHVGGVIVTFNEAATKRIATALEEVPK